MLARYSLTHVASLMFLIYIIDIRRCPLLSMFTSMTLHCWVTTYSWLFADNCIFYRTVTSLEDSIQLQHDLDSIFEWSQLWQVSERQYQKCAV